MWQLKYLDLASFFCHTACQALKDWGHAEAGVMRSMAVHTLLLARRSSGSKLLTINYGVYTLGSKSILSITIIAPK